MSRPHDFKGRSDRDCEVCGLPDRAAVRVPTDAGEEEPCQHENAAQETPSFTLCPDCGHIGIETLAPTPSVSEVEKNVAGIATGFEIGTLKTMAGVDPMAVAKKIRDTLTLIQSQREEIERLERKENWWADTFYQHACRKEEEETKNANLQDKRDALLEGMESIVKVDKTRYEHHEPRPDGMLPTEDKPRGTCWKTPKQIANRHLDPRGTE